MELIVTFDIKDPNYISSLLKVGVEVCRLLICPKDLIYLRTFLHIVFEFVGGTLGPKILGN